ncbi:hypothetical protein EYC80_008864 [Monilinia laxa]|uniref:Uncharacterized protein n=1 Tax=Monilinia laxa TaxID=61186 RepID=A0A5N6K1M3_MONLA|nr:hypothetical protein EYC80_008864 [Monilinia laxa]
MPSGLILLMRFCGRVARREWCCFGVGRRGLGGRGERRVGVEVREFRRKGRESRGDEIGSGVHYRLRYCHLVDLIPGIQTDVSNRLTNEIYHHSRNPISKAEIRYLRNGQKLLIWEDGRDYDHGDKTVMKA